MSRLIIGAAGGGASCALRKETPSACSSRTVVASVNGRRPPSTFSSVERLSLACSARDCREMRRRAISSRMVSATCRLCSAESCLSGVSIVTPFEFRHPSRRTIHRKAAQNRLGADATRLGIDVDLTVSGPTVRARVTQIFRNPTKNWVEATYVYPLPAGSAVDTLKMVIGDRVVVGDIKERQQARIIYEQAQRNGQKAALTEQERPNIFTNSVANIGPGETVLVQIEYQEPVQQMGNEFSLRVPMVVGPRYNPAPVVQSVDFRPNGGGWGATSTDPVPDRNRISPPVLDPAQHGPVNPTAITVRLQVGFPLGEVKSHHHQVKIDSPDDSTRVIRLAEGVVPADRDFELSWKPAAEQAPSVGLFREHVGDADYLLAFVTPPSVEAAEQKPLPREVIFVIDNSGSMGGTSIIQAKASLTTRSAGCNRTTASIGSASIAPSKSCSLIRAPPMRPMPLT